MCEQAKKERRKGKGDIERGWESVRKTDRQTDREREREKKFRMENSS